MRQVEVFRNGILAGTLIEVNYNDYRFRYDDVYYVDTSKPAICLTLPKSQQEYSSEYLFPYFFNILSEGVNKQLQCRLLKIDEDDSFGLLMATAQCDTIGAVTVKPVGE